MLQTTEISSLASTPASLEIHYQISMPQPESHLFEIRLSVRGWQSEVLDLKMPVWTPGSYLVREYARHIQNFEASGEKSLPWHKLSKNHWQVNTAGVRNISICYQVFANELTVRTNHLDQTHGYFNPAALCFYLPGYEQQPIKVTIAPPHPEWQVTTALPIAVQSRNGETSNTFTAADFDTLVDSPFEIGTHSLYGFEVLGKPHELAIWGQGNLQPAQAIADIRKIIEVEAELFGGLPYDRYLFILHLSANSYGGLEHKNSCTLHYPRFGFRAPEKYNRFLQLVAHEFFHLWNIKRIRPKALEVFDYDGENYTPSLWFSEGTTSYYDLVLPLRAGLYDPATFLKNLSQEITRYLTTLGRQVQPLSESSFDAWIKLYRRDANSDNNQISYYLKGEMVSLLLDLLIRSQHQNQRSLDDVLRQLWQQFGQPEIGFTPEQLEQVITMVAGVDLTDIFQHFLHSTEELPFDTYLAPFGLGLAAEDVSGHPPALGMTVKSENGKAIVKFVEADSPAQMSGLCPDDELLAINGVRITAEQLGDRLKDYQPGDAIQISYFHNDELRTTPLTLAAPRPMNYRIVPLEKRTPAQESNFTAWLGRPLSEIK
jgi:predicted metalloprotease with PDZ domain